MSVQTSWFHEMSSKVAALKVVFEDDDTQETLVYSGQTLLAPRKLFRVGNIPRIKPLQGSVKNLRQTYCSCTVAIELINSCPRAKIVTLFQISLR